MFEHHKKESPILSVLGMGGGVTSRIYHTAGGAGIYDVITPLAVEDSVYFTTELVGDTTDKNYLQRTQSAGNTKTWTFSTWWKPGKLGITNQRLLSSKSGGNQTEICIDSSDRIFVYQSGGDNYAATTNSFQNTSKWYHFCVTFDTTESAGADRVKIWVDGVQETIDYSTAGSGSVIGSNVDGFINANNYQLRIGSYATQGAPYLDGYLAHTYLIDGQALDPTSFAGYTSSAKTTIAPKAYSGSYAANSFFLKYANSGGINGYGSSGYATNGIGLDSSGQGNTFQPVRFNTATVTLSDSKASGMSVQAAKQTFDGDGYATESQPNPSGDYSFSPGLAYLGSAELKISGYHGYLQWRINGGGWNQVTDGLNATRYVTVDTGGGTINSFGTKASNFTAPMNAIRLDGCELVDVENFINKHSKDTPYNASPGTDNGAGGEVKSRYALLDQSNKSANLTVICGNQMAKSNSTNAQKVAFCDTFVSSGKWYFEFEVGRFFNVPTHNNGSIGVGVAKNSFGTSGNATTSSDSWIRTFNGPVYNGGSSVNAGAFTTQGGYGMVALDMDNGNIWFGMDGSWYNSGNPASGSNATYSNLSGSVTPCIWMQGSTANTATALHMGQRPFHSTAPSGFKVLCDANNPS